MTPRLRVIQVRIQPIAFLEVAEDDLRPLEHPPSNLSRKDFEDYVSSGRFKREVAGWEKALLAEMAEATPNRAARRRKPSRAKPSRKA